MYYLLVFLYHTHRYAVAHPPATLPHMRKWTPMSWQEVMAYLGIRVIIEMVDLPSYHDYWSTDHVFHHEIIAETMKRDQFDQLTTRLHFAHYKEGPPLPEDRMWKLQPVVDFLNDSFRLTFVPGQDIAIDESLLKFHGQLAFRTYN